MSLIATRDPLATQLEILISCIAANFFHKMLARRFAWVVNPNFDISLPMLTGLLGSVLGGAFFEWTHNLVVSGVLIRLEPKKNP